MSGNILDQWIKRLLNHPPNKVLEIDAKITSSSRVYLRDAFMVLLTENDKRANYEIVLEKPNNKSGDGPKVGYSIFRTNNEQLATENFSIFLHRLTDLMDIVKEFWNVSDLQKVCNKLLEQTSWTIAHLIVHFNLVKYVTEPAVLMCLEDPDYAQYMTPLLLAAKLGNVNMIKALLPHHRGIQHIDSLGNSVFHYAVPNKDIINLLAAKDVSTLSQINKEGYTPLHFACIADQPGCVHALLLAGANVNRLQDGDAEPASCDLRAFVGVNWKKLFTGDMKHGGTPLHWCTSRDATSELIQLGCAVNTRNFDNRTALHVMVARNCFECVITLLAHDAELDAVDNDGCTPLHLAIERKLVNIVQALVVFGCDVELRNRHGQTPRHMVGKETKEKGVGEILYILHSVGAKRCPDDNSEGCSTGCQLDGIYYGKRPEDPASVEPREHIERILAVNQTNGNNDSAAINPGVIVNTDKEEEGQSYMDAILSMFTRQVSAQEKPKQSTTDASKNQNPSPCRLLCLDGGGIRGLVLVQILLEIEKHTHKPITDLFDWIAGTSTGGILALALGCGKSLRSCMSLYLDLKDQCFQGWRPYPSDTFESVLKTTFGEHMVMTDIKQPNIMVTGVLADRKPVDLHLFRNYKNASELLGIVTLISNRKNPPALSNKQLVWEAARATGAAPSYFRSFGGFLDGGLIANNPTLDALTEIHEHNMALRKIGRADEAKPVSVVVSLGTGHVPVIELPNIDIYIPDSIFSAHKAFYGAAAILDLLVEQATCSEGRVVDRARAWCSSIGVPFYRFNPQLNEDIAMDEKNDEKLINMMWQVKAYMHKNRHKILEMAEHILLEETPSSTD